MHILAAVDLLRKSPETVVLEAAKLARLGNNTIVDLVFVLAPNDNADARKLELHGLLKHIDLANRGISRCERGDTITAIANTAQKFDMLLIGSRRPTNQLERVFLGSVAKRTARQVGIPLFVSRRQSSQHHAPKVLLGLDSQNASETIKMAMPTIVALGGVVDIVHFDSSALPWTVGSHPNLDRSIDSSRQREKDKAKLFALLQTFPNGHQGTVIVESGDAATDLSEMSADYDIVAITASTRSTFSRFLLGTVTEQVIEESTSHVLVFPPIGAGHD
jgi:nucleotide-binding universal stress UspA family protein